MHSHSHSCSCGHTHEDDHRHEHTEHTHEENCSCGHDHDETCGCGCGCGHTHAHLTPGDGSLSESQADALLAIHQRGYLPIARFALKSSRNEEAYVVALEPVYIAEPAEDINAVKENGELFSSLEDLGFITLDYDLPLTGYPYKEYKESALYAQFLQTVKEAGERPEFLFDTPCLELGSIALTEEGQAALQKLMA